MKNVSIIYWSGTRNTQKMAEAVAEGAKIDGITFSVIDVLEATKEDVLKADAIAIWLVTLMDIDDEIEELSIQREKRIQEKMF